MSRQPGLICFAGSLTFNNSALTADCYKEFVRVFREQIVYGLCNQIGRVISCELLLQSCSVVFVFFVRKYGAHSGANLFAGWAAGFKIDSGPRPANAVRSENLVLCVTADHHSHSLAERQIYRSKPALCYENIHLLHTFPEHYNLSNLSLLSFNTP